MSKTPNVLDLSHHNTFTSLEGVKAKGILAVIHKLTEGTGFRDSQAKHHVPLIRDADLLLGLYHFIRPGNVAKQIDFFLATAAPLMDDDTLLCCDFEDTGVSLTDVLTFLQAVETHTTRSPVLYGGSILKAAALKDLATAKKLANYRFWLAQYGPKAVLPKGFTDLWLWQYSETGKMSGISGNVDLDYFAGTDDELRSQWSGKQTSESQPQKKPAPNLQGNTTDTESQTASATNGTPNTAKVEITDGNVKVETKTPAPGPKERVAVVKAVPQKWYTVVWAKITAFVTGNALFQWIWAQLETISGLKVPTYAWYVVSGIVVLGSLMWIVDAILENHKANTINNQIDQLLVTQNSTGDNFVQLIPADEAALYRARGYKVITRGETVPEEQKPVPPEVVQK